MTATEQYDALSMDKASVFPGDGKRDPVTGF